MCDFPHSTMYLCQYLWNSLMKILQYVVFPVYHPTLVPIWYWYAIYGFINNQSNYQCNTTHWYPTCQVIQVMFHQFLNELILYIKRLNDSSNKKHWNKRYDSANYEKFLLWHFYSECFNQCQSRDKFSHSELYFNTIYSSLVSVLFIAWITSKQIG